MAEVSCVRSAASQCDSRPFNFEATEPSSAGETSTLGDDFGLGVGEGISVGFGGGVGVAVATGVGCGVAFGVGAGVAVGFGFGVGVAVAFGLGVRVGRGVEKTGGGVLLEGNGRVGENVSVVIGLEGEGDVTFGGEVVGRTGRGVVPESVFVVGVEGAIGRGVLAGGAVAGVASMTGPFGIGDAIEIGVVAGVSAGRSDNDSNGFGAGVVTSNGSGEAVSSGLTEALGLAIALAVGFGRGEDEGEGDGVSAAAAGLLCRNGVEAASCARTRAAVTKNTVARTNERMMVIRFLAGFVCRR